MACKKGLYGFSRSTGEAKALLRVAVFTSTMNFRLTPKKEKAEKHVGVHCFYCKRVLQNRQALGGHLKVHKEEINAKRSQRYASHFSNSEITTHNAHPFSMLHPEIFSGVAGSNPSNLIGKLTSPLNFSKRFYSNQNSQVNVRFVSKSYENNTSAMPPKFSSSSGHAKIPDSKPLSFMAASCFTAVPTGIPSGPSFSFVINGVCELNNDQFQSFMDGMPYLQAHIDGIISYHVKAVTDLDSDLRSNQSAGFKEPSTGGSLPSHPSQSSGQGEIGQCKTETVLTSKKRKRCSLHEARGSAEMMNALKRPKINSELSMETDKPPHLSQSSRQGEIGLYKTQTALNSIGGKRHCFGEGGGNAEIMNAPSMESDKPPKRELLLFKDSENCFSGSGIASNVKEENQTNLDLSLHL